MEKLNKEAYKVESDELIYDRYRVITIWNVPISVPDGESGILKRGQVIDFDESNDVYEMHKKDGRANCIVARNTPYSKEESEITASVYISGDFRTSACVTDEKLTRVDLEHLRSSGIILK